MRILVTGGAGFIGSNVAKRLVADGHGVVVVDDFSSGSWKNMVGFGGDAVTVDVARDDLGALRDLGPFDVISHQASITDTTVMDERRMMENNVEGFRRLLELAVKWNSRVIWASSAAAYGRLPAPHAESLAPAPLNVYGYSKVAMERLAAIVQPRLKHPIVGLRYFNVYGPGEAHKRKFASMIHQLARQMRAGKRPRIFTDGEQMRDFVYIDDVVQANLRAMETKAPGVFNVGCGKAQSFNAMIARLNEVLKTNLPPEYFENPYDFYQTLTEADLGLIRKNLGYEPKYDLARGIAAYAESGTLGV